MQDVGETGEAHVRCQSTRAVNSVISHYDAFAPGWRFATTYWPALFDFGQTQFENLVFEGSTRS